MTVPASYKNLINDVESELRNVDVNTSLNHPRHPLNVAGKVIQRAVEWVNPQIEKQKQRIDELEAELTKTRELVRNRDKIIAERGKLLQTQNDIISGLHAQRRTQVGELNAAVISLFEALGIDSVVVSDERMRQTAAHATGAQYALTVTHERGLMQTRFEIINTGESRA